MTCSSWVRRLFSWFLLQRAVSSKKCRQICWCFQAISSKIVNSGGSSRGFQVLPEFFPGFSRDFNLHTPAFEFPATSPLLPRLGPWGNAPAWPCRRPTSPPCGSGSPPTSSSPRCLPSESMARVHVYPISSPKYTKVWTPSPMGVFKGLSLDPQSETFSVPQKTAPCEAGFGCSHAQKGKTTNTGRPVATKSEGVPPSLVLSEFPEEREVSPTPEPLLFCASEGETKRKTKTRSPIMYGCALGRTLKGSKDINR